MYHQKIIKKIRIMWAFWNDYLLHLMQIWDYLIETLNLILCEIFFARIKFSICGFDSSIQSVLRIKHFFVVNFHF